MDLEGETIICALRRLSGQTAVRTVTTPPWDRHPPLPTAAAELLTRDSEAYTLSLLLRPEGPRGYTNLHPALAPSSSRAWTAACHLYLHLVLPRRGAGLDLDRHFWRWLLATLREHVDAAVPAVRLGRACPDLWAWCVVLCLHAARRAVACCARQQQQAQVLQHPLGYGGGGGVVVLGRAEFVADWLPWARGRLAEWSLLHGGRGRAAAGAADWAGFRSVLERTAWPSRETAAVEGEDFLRRVWLQAVALGGGAGGLAGTVGGGGDCVGLGAFS